MTGWQWCANFVCLHSVNFSVAKLLVGWDLTQLFFFLSLTFVLFCVCVRGFSFFIGTMARYLWCHCLCSGASQQLCALVGFVMLFCLCDVQISVCFLAPAITWFASACCLAQACGWSVYYML